MLIDDPDWPHTYPCPTCGGNGCGPCRGTGEREDYGDLPPLAALSLGFVATSPTPEHADAHIEAARERGATDVQIDHALRLMRDQQAACVHTIGGNQ